MGIIHRGTRYPYAILLNGFLSLFLFSRLAIHPCSLIFNYSSNVRHSFSKIVDSKVKLIYPDWLAKRVRKVKDTISPISSFYNSFRLLIVTQVTICFDSNFLSCARNFVESYERKKKKKKIIINVFSLKEEEEEKKDSISIQITTMRPRMPELDPLSPLIFRAEVFLCFFLFVQLEI